MDKILLPPCKNWKIWEGKEIEGYTDIDHLTLFIRKANKTEIVKYSKEYDRIWFCSEYNNTSESNIIFLKSLSKKMIFDLTYEKYLKLLKSKRFDILNHFQLYVRINQLNLKENDHVKIGNTFFEESFLVGNGKVVDTKKYHEDKFIK